MCYRKSMPIYWGIDFLYLVGGQVLRCHAVCVENVPSGVRSDLPVFPSAAAEV